VAKSESMWHIGPSDILYEDDAVIVVNKPNGLPAQATLDPARDHCFASVMRYLNGGYAGLHHRLDAATSGAILLSKSQAANASLSRQFQTHTIRKGYVAIGCGQGVEAMCVGSHRRLENGIGEGARIRGVQMFCVGGKKARRAVTDITCESAWYMRDGVVGCFLCQPQTGRTHQIRVHMASLGLGIVGDPLYGDGGLRSLRAMAPGRLCLHASWIAFEHPLTGEPLHVACETPPEMITFMKKIAQAGKPIAACTQNKPC